jgi:hypothetical protein
MVLPDLEYYIDQYRNDVTPNAALAFMQNTLLGEPQGWKGFYGFFTYFFGTSKHRWMWDYKGLKKELEKAGLSEVRRAIIGNCEDENLRAYFEQVESPGRLENCLGVQCRTSRK